VLWASAGRFEAAITASTAGATYAIFFAIDRLETKSFASGSGVFKISGINATMRQIQVVRKGSVVPVVLSNSKTERTAVAQGVNSQMRIEDTT
jgi:hypothetical protein